MTDKPHKPTGAAAHNGALAELGIDAFCDKIMNGQTQLDIATELGIDKSRVTRWIAESPERITKSREARIHAASVWDEMAEHTIRDAGIGETDPDQRKFALAKAHELALHYRWRAAKIAPKEYGDKVQTEHSGSVAIERIERVIVDPKAG